MEDLLTSSYKPTAQLTVYNNKQNAAYIEYSEIKTENGKTAVSEGKPLTKKTLKSLLNLVLTSDKTTYATISKLLPEAVIYYDPRPGKIKLIWYSKPLVRIIDGIYKNTSKVKIPAILYMLDGDTFYIYVLKSSKRPEMKTQLFHAPFPNVHEGGNVCMGSVKHPSSKIEIADLIVAWEVAFWNSTFTDHLWDKKQNELFKKSIRERVQFPSKLLIGAKKTIKTLLANG